MVPPWLSVTHTRALTRSHSHRHIYGADAAKFLADLAQLLEEDTASLLM